MSFQEDQQKDARYRGIVYIFCIYFMLYLFNYVKLCCRLRDTK